MPGWPLYVVDAFTSVAFGGNPAGVVVMEGDGDGGIPDASLAEPRSASAYEAWMRAVAGEMNLSETAFVAMNREGVAVRWFTPGGDEVELCGHATLATAHVLWESGRVPPELAIAFQTRFRGELVCQREAGGFINMNFPADRFIEAEPPPELWPCLRVAPAEVRAVGRTRYDWLVELADEAAVRAAEPDFARLREIECRGVCLTAAVPQREVESPIDVVSRFFAPRLRIEEDPVTGSAHCSLGPYWAARLGKRTLHCEQASRRGGRVRVTVLDDDRVELAGRAVTVTRGELLVGPTGGS